MRFDLRLHGRTADGRACRADITAYAGSQRELREQADHASQTAAWMYTELPHDPVPEGSQITVVGVKQLHVRRPDRPRQPKRR